MNDKALFDALDKVDSDPKLKAMWDEINNKRKIELENSLANEVTMDFCGLTIPVDKGTLKLYQEWREKVSLPDEEQGAIGGEFTYCMTPTSLGIVYVVEHCKGAKFNLTNFALW